MLRQPAVADLFYPGDPEALAAIFAHYPQPSPQPITPMGLVVPHAGYRYSGMVAASVYAAVKLPATLILLGPNHRGRSAGSVPPRGALFGAGAWETPLGRVNVNDELTDLLRDENRLLQIDPSAHREEHALEVQLPLILHYAPATPTIVPISLSMTTSQEVAALGAGMARAIARFSGEVAIVASTDFSHYVPMAQAREDDRAALDQIEQLDPETLLATVRQRHISMCGVGPVAAMLTACKAMGGTMAKIVDYRTSGDVTGDDSSVVGYGGAVIY